MTFDSTAKKLWTSCEVLKDSGVPRIQFLTELSQLLYLKLMHEAQRDEVFPDGFRWSDLRAAESPLEFYQGLLNRLGKPSCNNTVRSIFQNSSTHIPTPEVLNRLISAIEALEISPEVESLGDIYEAILERYSQDKKSGAGQYFTPRPLVECIIDLMQPQPGEIIQDPSAGAGGFLVEANRYIQRNFDTSCPQFWGTELVEQTYQLLLMNASLHGMEGGFYQGNTLSVVGQSLPLADVILANPPFGTARGEVANARTDLPFPTSMKQLEFLQHIYLGLAPGGRAAVIIPDNVLFDESQGTKVRVDLMDKCNLHTVLKLPSGIYYAGSVRTNVLFFQKGLRTQKTWVYDMRTGVPTLGRRNPLQRKHFADFELCYGSDPNGSSPRTDLGGEGRFKCFTREEIAANRDRLDLVWLWDEDKVTEPPEKLLVTAKNTLQGIIAEIEALSKTLAMDLEIQ